MEIFVSISGNIGVGKTTLLNLLGELNFPIVKEDTESSLAKTLLENYYERKDEETLLALQEYYFGERIKMFASLKKESKGGFFERCVGEDSIFLWNGVENGIIDEEKARTFLREKQKEIKECGYPDVVVYLKNGVDGLLDNIKERGRSCEQNTSIDRSYLEKLEKGYQRFMEEISGSTKILVVENNCGDFVKAESLVQRVNEVFLEKENGFYFFYSQRITSYGSIS